MASARRTIDRSTAQPFQNDEDISQELPEHFDDADLSQDLGRFFEEAETGADLLIHTRLPDGVIDKQLDAEVVPAGRDWAGRMLHAAEGSQLARLAAGQAASVSVRRNPVKGGTRIEATFTVQPGAPEVTIETPPCADDAALEAMETVCRAMAYAGAAEMARVGFVKVGLDPRIGTQADADALSTKLARRA